MRLRGQAYGEISKGFAAFMQCKKIVDTPFPFPYAQMVLIFLIVLTVILPIQINIIVNHTFLAVALCFVTVRGNDPTRISSLLLCNAGAD